MKLCRFNDDRFGLYDEESDTVADVSAALNVIPSHRYPLPRHDLLIANLAKVRVEAKRLLPRARKVPLSKGELLPPVANPGKIIIAPLNY